MWTKINVFFNHFLPQKNRFGGVMVCVLSSSVVDREFEPRSGQTKNYKIGMFCFSAKHAALKKRDKTGCLGIRIISPRVGGMSIRGLLFQ
jgi:hypothetical protein